MNSEAFYYLLYLFDFSTFPKEKNYLLISLKIFVPIYLHDFVAPSQLYSSCLWLKANVNNPQDSVTLAVSEIQSS